MCPGRHSEPMALQDGTGQNTQQWPQEDDSVGNTEDLGWDPPPPGPI